MPTDARTRRRFPSTSMIEVPPAPIREAMSSAARARRAEASRVSSRPVRRRSRSATRSVFCALSCLASAIARPSPTLMASSSAAELAVESSTASNGTPCRSAQRSASPSGRSIRVRSANAACSSQRPAATAEPTVAPFSARTTASASKIARQLVCGEMSCVNTVRRSSPEVATTAAPSARKRAAI